MNREEKLEAALREALKLVNGDNTRQAGDVLREQWERLLEPPKEYTEPALYKFARLATEFKADPCPRTYEVLRNCLREGGPKLVANVLGPRLLLPIKAEIQMVNAMMLWEARINDSLYRAWWHSQPRAHPPGFVHFPPDPS